MAISGIDNYRDTLYQWQNQQLKATGNSSANSSSGNALNLLFGGSTSMTSQVASMVELTRYAMNAMGLGSDSRVTFSQITRYREQLQNEFNEGVKNGLAESGIQNLTSLGYEIDVNGKITVTGGSAQDRKAAQAWVDANPTIGETILKALPTGALEEMAPVAFTISGTGRMTVVNQAEAALQASLNSNIGLADSVRAGLAEAGIAAPSPLSLIMEDGKLMMEGDSEQAEAVNDWLAEHTELGDKIAKELESRKIAQSSVSITLGKEGAAQISVNNANLNDLQAGFDTLTDTGSRLIAALGSLGIDKNITFSLQVDDNGALKVISDHPDAARLQMFFDENPDLVKKYRQIETLAGIDDARKSMQLSPSAMRKRIQIESMAAWWADSGSANSYFGNYSNNSLSLLSGLNLSV